MQRKSATAAHAGAVYHYRVHGHRTGYSGGLGSLYHKFHHYQWPDGYNLIKPFTLGKHLVKRNAYVAMTAVRAIVRHKEQPVRRLAELILKYNYIL